MRAVVLLIAGLCLAGAAWAAARGPAAPVVVGDVRLADADAEGIERLWLAGEAAARGLRPAADLPGLRAQVADALAGSRPLPGPARFAAVFERFHERWRARTRCLPAHRDPHDDRCGDVPSAAAGTCRWMGEATLCSLGPGVRRRWLVVYPRAKDVRVRSRAAALALVRAAYVTARAPRDRAAAAARRKAERARTRRERAAAADRRAAERARARRERARSRRERAAAAARREAALDARRRDPRLAGPELAAARSACERQLRESDPYLFGFGMQDVAGQAEGLIAARAELAERLAAAARDDIDREKLRPLLDALAAGSRELSRMARADPHAVSALAARFDARTETARAAARRLGLGDCVARTAR